VSNGGPRARSRRLPPSVVGAVRERWRDLRVNLHLPDTRGLGLANAYAGLEMGIAIGIDVEKLIAAARLAEDIVGRPLPGSV